MAVKQKPIINPLVQEAYNRKARALSEFAQAHGHETTGIIVAILPNDVNDADCKAAQAHVAVNACHHRVAALGKALAEVLGNDPTMLGTFVMSFLDVVADKQSAELTEMRNYSDKVH